MITEIINNFIISYKKSTIMIQTIGPTTIIILVPVFFHSLFFSTIVNAQDPQFTQPYSAPLYLNPSFAGSVGCSRISLNYRNDWLANPSDFMTFHLSYDQFVHPIRGGVGIDSWYDIEGGGIINTYYNGLIYSPKLIFKNKILIAPSIEFGYGKQRMNWQKLNFTDTTNINSYFTTSSLSKSDFLDISSGILLNTENFYSGIAVDHLGMFTNQYRFPMKIIIHGGAVFPLKQIDKSPKLSPNLIYQRQQDFQQINFGLYINKGKITGGFWYRMAEKTSDALSIVIGFQQGIAGIGYSYDFTLSKLTNLSAGSHEVSLRLLFNCKNKEGNIIPLKTIAF